MEQLFTIGLQLSFVVREHPSGVLRRQPLHWLPRQRGPVLFVTIRVHIGNIAGDYPHFAGQGAQT
jgi:hypothetical protein